MNPVAELLIPDVRELIKAGEYSELRDALHHVPAADVADILAELDPADAAVGFRFLQRDDAAEVFTYLAPEKQEELIGTLGTTDSVRVIEAMSADDRARILDELPEAVAQKIVASLSPEDRKVTQAILGYAPRTVGRLMTPDYITVRPSWTIGQALEHVRRVGRDAETINVIYVTDEKGVLIDDLRLRQVLLSDPSQPIESIMNRSYVALKADEPQEEAVLQLQRYDRVALPVVDSRGALIGIVTHDDVADAAQQEVTEDMQMLGGVQALEEPFMQSNAFYLYKKRAPWLSLLFLSELLTSNAIGAFEGQIERAAILAAFIPGIISSGGNSGSQASTLVIRALGLQEIKLGDWWRVLRRELFVCLMLGLTIGAIGFLRINVFGWFGWFRDADVQRHYLILACAIAMSLIFVVMWGSIIGAMLPFLLKRLRLDPAASSTPFVATLVDVTGIIIYFACAIMLLSSTLLRDHETDRPLKGSIEAHVISASPSPDGDPTAIIEVQTSDQTARNEASRIEAPMKLFENGLPQRGDDVVIEFEVEKATAVRPREPR